MKIYSNQEDIHGNRHEFDAIACGTVGNGAIFAKVTRETFDEMGRLAGPLAFLRTWRTKDWQAVEIGGIVE